MIRFHHSRQQATGNGQQATVRTGIPVACCLLTVACSLLSAFGAAADDDFFKPKDEDKRNPAGKSETLRHVPKKFATLQGADAAKHTATLLVDGEKEAKTWPINSDAELKFHGWWGRLEQFRPGDRVWVWFDVNRKKEPRSVLMLADEMSQQDINGKPVSAESFELLRSEQKTWLRERWRKEGLPGSVSFLHPLGGEMDVILDHEAIRWGRSLKKGDVIKLASTNPIDGLIKEVRPWRERTQLRLVVNGLDQADLSIGQRIQLRMPTPPAEVDESKLPPDLDRPRNKEERVEWFLASIYCSCSIAGDRCTGMFYTLASCNTHACGMPNFMRQRIGKLIDEGMTDAQIFEVLLKEQGPLVLKQHLLP